ncbi:MAG: hypothetical protein R3F39_00810 [Myxococcota bacterium]
MPIAALRSVEAHFDRIMRHVMPKRLAAELKVGDKGFHFKYFKGYRPEAIGRGRIKQIAMREVFQDPGNELFANLLIIHWNEQHAPLYREMVTHVKTINEDVEAIESIDDDKAHSIIDDLVLRHELPDVLLCVRLNGVRFSEELIASRLERGEPRGEATTAAPAAAEGDPGAEAGEAEAKPKKAKAAAGAEPKSAAKPKAKAKAATES